MPVYKSSTPTKDGKCWFYKIQYTDSLCNIIKYTSKKFMTRAIAKDEERKHLNRIEQNNKAPEKLTLGDLWLKFLAFQDDKVKRKTKEGYTYKEKHLKSLWNIPCSSFNITHVEDWKKRMNKETNLNDVSKNDVLKVLCTLINFGIKYYNYNYSQLLKLIEKFKNPDEVKKEQEIYSPAQFEIFLSVEDDPRYRCLWKILFHGGLRIGEARGLQWKDINFEKKTMSISKQVQNVDRNTNDYYICSLKTASSKRVLPLLDVFYNDLLEYYNYVKQFKNFNEDFFVFGEDFGLRALTYPLARRRKKANAIKAGIKEIRIHDFRHSCASFLINKGIPITVVSKYLGHASITETLNTYSHMFQDSFSNVNDMLNEFYKIEA